MPKAQQGFAAVLPALDPFPGNQPQRGGPYFTAGAPSAGTSCVQTVTLGGTPTGGTFTLIFNGQETGTIAWTATDATLASNIATALNALSNIGASGVAGAVGTGNSGIGTYTVTFQNQNAVLTVPAMVIGSNKLTGTAPTVTVAVTTAGVTATLRGSDPGTDIVDYTGPRRWTNTGTLSAPSFARQGTNIAVVALTATTATTGGAVGSWTPPEGAPVMITRAWIYVATKSTGAATVDVGVAANATTSNDTLIDGADVGTASNVVKDNISDASTNGLSRALLTGVQYVTFTGLADTTGMVATGFVEYLKP
jgi:hypothetical protein